MFISIYLVRDSLPIFNRLPENVQSKLKLFEERINAILYPANLYIYTY